MIKRKLVHIAKSQELTIRGNPRWYWFILECGHVTLEHHGPRVVVRECALELMVPIMVRCRDCEENKPVDVRFLSRITPWQVWKQQNFDRFETTKTK